MKQTEFSQTDSRLPTSLLKFARASVGAGLILWPILWQIDPGRLLSAHLGLVQFTLIQVMFACCFLSLHLTVEKSGKLSRYVFGALTVVSLALGIALYHHFAGDDALFIRPTLWLITLSLTMAALTISLVSNVSGAHFAILILSVAVLGFLPQFVSGGLSSPPIRLERYIVYLTFGGDGFLGRAAKILSEVVAVFVIFGAVMNAIGANHAVGRLAMLAARRGRGASIKVAVLASAIFGTISGSATSNVMTSGSFSISGMRKLGLTGAQAGGVEAVASTMGQLIPPIMGAAAFLMSDFTGLPYLTIAASAVLPAGLCVLFLFLNADSMARRLGSTEGVGQIPADEEMPKRSDLWFVLPAGAIVAGLVANPSQVPMAGVYGIVFAILAGIAHSGMSQTYRGLISQFISGAKSVASLVVTGSALGVIIAVLSITGYDTLISIRIGQLGEANLFASLILCALAAIILGTGMATTGVYIVVAIMLAPGLIALGVPKIAAHFFVLYFGAVSMITPPVAFAVLAASSLTGAGFYRTGMSAIAFGWVLFVMPFLVVYFPGLVLVGTYTEIAVDVGISLFVLGAIWILIKFSLDLLDRH